MTTKEAKQLIVKYNADKCTEAEKALLENWFEIYNEHELDISRIEIKQIGEQIKKQLPHSDNNKNPIKLWSVITAVASVSLIGISILMFYPNHETVSTHNKSAHDIAPGGNKAILTLANGKTINLSADKTGVIIDNNNIRYSDSTAIVNGNDSNVSGLATISTPKGGEYQITLPDGTKVWLNAATTLQFSANLKRERGERKVRLESGEAYFEVYKDKKRPFVVATGQQEVSVLGTHFNINAYEPGSTKTTLLEGSVRVQSTNNLKLNSKILVPGEQSITKAGSIKISKVNTAIELAWKKGKIQFVREDLKTVINMVSRWYNIDVIYQYYPTGGKFTGSISRSKNISEVLNLLESTGDVRFKIQGRQVFVMK